MSDFSINNKVVQANSLVQQANWQMNTMPLKIFKTLVSCIDVKNPKNEVAITKKELSNFLNTGENYTYLRQQVKSLQKQIVEIKKDDDLISLSVLPKVVWKAKDDTVICYFDNDIMPYLVELNTLFLQYDVASLKQISTKYGLILYEYLLSKERQLRLKEHTYEVSVDDLRRLTGTCDKYKAFKDFEKKVLRVAEKDINNASVEFLVQYKKKKVGRAIESIAFKIRKRTSVTETEFNDVVHPEWIFQEI